MELGLTRISDQVLEETWVRSKSISRPGSVADSAFGCTVPKMPWIFMTSGRNVRRSQPNGQTPELSVEANGCA